MIDREKYKIAPDVTVEYAMKDPNGTMRSVVDTPGVSTVEKFTGPDNMGWTKTSVPGKPAVTKHDYAEGLRGNVIDPNTTIEYGIKNGTNINNYVDTPKGTTITTGIQNSNPGGGDMFGVRQAMKNFGMSDTDIGWNNGTVTYGGQNFMTPTVNDNGTTKASAKEIIDAMNNYYITSGQKNQIDSVAKTVAGMGLSHAVEYGENGVVTVGGMPLKNVNIMNGVAYAPYSEIVNAVNSFKKQNDYYNPVENFDSTFGKDESKIRTIADKIGNYKGFTYNPEDDIAYQVYKEQYLKNAQKAADDTWGRNAARSGGYGNSAAMVASDQTYYDHMGELNNIIPLLMDKAYGRHRDGLNDLYREIELYGTPEEFNANKANAYNANADVIDKALKGEYDRDWAEKEYAEDVRRFNIENERAQKYQDEYWKRYDEDREYKKAYDEKDFALREQALNIQRAMSSGGGGGGGNVRAIITDPVENETNPEDKLNHLINTGEISPEMAEVYRQQLLEKEEKNRYADINKQLGLPSNFNPAPASSGGGGGGSSRSTTKKKSSSGSSGGESTTPSASEYTPVFDANGKLIGTQSKTDKKKVVNSAAGKLLG